MIYLMADLDKKHLKRLCDDFSLGRVLTEPAPVEGGFHHRMWELKTDAGHFALKQLANDVDLDDPDVRCHYESSESVSRCLANRGIPAVTALTHDDRSVQILDNAGYLVYPWVTAKALHRDEIKLHHLQQIARIFAAMHQANVSIEGLAKPDPEITDEETLSLLTWSARKRNSPRAAELEQWLPSFRQIIERHKKSSDALMRRTVVSHGDLDHKNVLWQSSTEPLLIDWESARNLNPTHEVILEALDWSGITLDFNQDKFNAFTAAYCEAGGDIRKDELEAAFDCVSGDWLNWLLYNLGRSISLDNEQDRQTGLQQVDLSMVTITHLQRRLPALLESLQ